MDIGAGTWTTPPTGATQRVETGVYIVKFVVATEPKATHGTEATDNYTRTNSTVARIGVFAVRGVVNTGRRL